MAYIKFESKKYNIPAGSTAEETLSALQQVMPEMANAKLTKDGDNYKAEVAYGKKG